MRLPIITESATTVGRAFTNRVQPDVAFLAEVSIPGISVLARLTALRTLMALAANVRCHKILAHPFIRQTKAQAEKIRSTPQVRMTESRVMAFG